MTTTIEYLIAAIYEVRPSLRNTRTHPKKQVDQIAASIAENGFTSPILVNPRREIIAGHGRLLAAKQLGLTEIPIIVISGLSEAQERRLRIADNKIGMNAGWDTDLLRVELAEIELSGLDLSLTGFSVGELDVLRGLKLETQPKIDPVPSDAISETGDIWICGHSRVGCGDLLDRVSLAALMAGEKADAIVADPPYNTSNATHNGGKGQFKHREFKYAHGEMSKNEFVDFLAHTQGAMASHSKPNAVAFIFMDHHHAGEQIEAGDIAFHRRLNIAIWVKSNAGMGSLYRSGHEMVFIHVVGDAPHRNNVALGKHGRNRTNVWNAASVNAFGSRQDDLALHPTVKPIQLIADAVLDVTAPGDIVLDGFLGSGTSLLAATRVKRRAYGLEIDPAYVDVAIGRWRDLTGLEPVLEGTGETFGEVRLRRTAERAAAASAKEGV